MPATGRTGTRIALIVPKRRPGSVAFAISERARDRAPSGGRRRRCGQFWRLAAPLRSILAAGGAAGVHNERLQIAVEEIDLAAEQPLQSAQAQLGRGRLQQSLAGGQFDLDEP